MATLKTSNLSVSPAVSRSGAAGASKRSHAVEIAVLAVSGAVGPVEAALRTLSCTVRRIADPAELAQAPDAGLDLVVVEIPSGDDPRVELIRLLKRHHPEIRIVVIAACATDDLLLQTVLADADGFISAGRDPAELARLLLRAVDGEALYEQAVLRRLVKGLHSQLAALHEAMDVFTHRELQIARLVTAGLSNKEIASRLFVAEGTVKCHVHNILVKAKVGSRAALAKYGRERGLA